MKTARKLISIIWTTIPPVLLSALVHTTDPDIGGINGLTSYAVLWSVLFFAVPAVLFCFGALAALVSSGWPAFLFSSVVFSSLVAIVLTIFGSGATTRLGFAWTFFGSATLVFLFLTAAVIPAATFGWPKNARSVPA